MTVFQIIENPPSQESPGTIDPDDGFRMIWVEAYSRDDVLNAIWTGDIVVKPEAVQSLGEISSNPDLLGIDLKITNGEVIKKEQNHEA